MRNYLLLGSINWQLQCRRSSETFSVVICEAVASDATTCVHCTCETTDHTARFPMWSSWILFVSPANVSRCGRGSRGSASVTCLHFEGALMCKEIRYVCLLWETARGSSGSFLEQQRQSKAETTTSPLQFHPGEAAWLRGGWGRESVLWDWQAEEKGSFCICWSLFCWEE